MNEYDKEAGFHSEPLVKKGDEVKRGLLLADSNNALSGSISLGRNLTTAIVL